MAQCDFILMYLNNREEEGYSTIVLSKLKIEGYSELLSEF